MDDPILYNKVNNLQFEDTRNFLEEYVELVKWRPEGSDMILDIGCGTGNVTSDVLLRMVPRNIRMIVATDINEKMIKNAAKNYVHPKMEFDVLDIGDDVPDHFKNKLDHVFSFFCLHWIQDQKKVMNNIYSMLRSGGDTLFCLTCKCAQIYDTYIKMAADPRWSEYMYDVQSILLPYQHESQPEKVLKNNLESAGFKVEICEKKNKKFIYTTDKSLSDFMESINPFMKRIPENERKGFMDYFIKEVKEGDSEKKNNCETTKHYSLLMAYAVKP